MHVPRLTNGDVNSRTIVVVAAMLSALSVCAAHGQIVYRSGQNVALAFEGWEQNPDGSCNMVFGYFNRNLDEALDIPIGPDNNLEPGGPDQGQPTHFLPQRNKYVFRVKVPKDFGSKELVWSVTARGKTERAYASLRPEYVLNDAIMLKDAGIGGLGGDEDHDQAPVVRVEGALQRDVKVGEPLALTAVASDDDLPHPTNAARGLRLAWFVYRGVGTAVTFSPEQFKVYPDRRRNANSPFAPGWVRPPVPSDGRFTVSVTFREPGMYVLRVLAHDGGLQSSQDVTVSVTNPGGALAR